MCKRFDTEMACGYKLRAICNISRESITFYGVGWYPSNKNLTELYASRLAKEIPKLFTPGEISDVIYRRENHTYSLVWLFVSFNVKNILLYPYSSENYCSMRLVIFMKSKEVYGIQYSYELLEHIFWNRLYLIPPSKLSLFHLYSVGATHIRTTNRYY